MDVKLFNAVILCKRDERFIEWHIQRLNELGVPMERWFYYGVDPQNGLPTCNHTYWVVDALELYENLPVKTYGLLKHALTRPDWTHLLKTDVNSYPYGVDWEAVKQHDMVGYWSDRPPGRNGHLRRVRQGILNESYTGPLPGQWCGGPAYIISRRLAEKVVERGVWYARGCAYEDVMVSVIANESGMPPQPGLGYFTDGRRYHN